MSGRATGGTLSREIQDLRRSRAPRPHDRRFLDLCGSNQASADEKRDWLKPQMDYMREISTRRSSRI
jgi:hypothetical protein